MNILHLASEYPPQKVFGLGRFVCDLAEEQVRQGHDVTVITNSLGGDLHESMSMGVRVLRIAPPPPKPPSVSGQIMVFNILLLRRAAHLGWNELNQVDVICSHDFLTAPAAQALCDTFGMPHVCTFHDVLSGKRLGRPSGEFDKFSIAAERWAAENATHIIANSQATKSELIQAYGVVPDRVSVVTCAIAPKVFELSDDSIRLRAFRNVILSDHEKLVLYVGRLDAEKGVNILLEAYSRIAQGKAVHLCIAGSGALLDSLKLRAQQLSIPERVSFFGYVELPALAALYKSADIFVCPSLYEPFGLVALEAMLHGLPVIASNTGGLKEIIVHESTGLLVEPGNIDNLCAAMLRLVNDDEVRTRFGHAGQSHVFENFTWNSAARATVLAYQAFQKKTVANSLVDCEHLFIASNMEGGQGYGNGRHTRGIFNFFVDQPRLSVVSNTENNFFALNPIDRRDEAILHALQLAAGLLKFIKTPPKTVTLTHWNGWLAMSVIACTSDCMQVRFCCPTLRNTQIEHEGTQFELAMWIDAATAAHEVLVEDSITREYLKSKGITSLERPINTVLPIVQTMDREGFRSSLAATSEKIGIVATRLEFPFSAAHLINLWKALAQIGLSMRWIICGEGPERDLLIRAAAEQKISAMFPGYVPERTLSGLFNMVDFALAPYQVACYSRFIEDAAHAKLPMLVALGTKDVISKPTETIYEVDFSDSHGAAEALAEAVFGNLKAEISKFSRVMQTDNRNLLLYNNWGLGDELLLTAVARELKRVYPFLNIWVKSRFGFKLPSYIEAGVPPAGTASIETIYQNPVMCGPQYHSPYPGHLVQQMLAKIELETGLHVVAEQHHPEIVVQTVLQRCGVVMHSRPNPRLPTKDWGILRWSRLAELLHKRGVSVVQVGAKDEPLLPHVCDMRGLHPSKIPDIVAGAELVICLAGFLMHLAACADTPAIVIYGGREHPAIDGYPGHIHLSSEPLDCRGRWGCHLGTEVECPNSMRCMSDLSPELVEKLAMLTLNSAG